MERGSNLIERIHADQPGKANTFVIRANPHNPRHPRSIGLHPTQRDAQPLYADSITDSGGRP